MKNRTFVTKLVKTQLHGDRKPIQFETIESYLKRGGVIQTARVRKHAFVYFAFPTQTQITVSAA